MANILAKGAERLTSVLHIPYAVPQSEGDMLYCNLHCCMPASSGVALQSRPRVPCNPWWQTT